MGDMRLGVSIDRSDSERLGVSVYKLIVELWR